MSRSPPATSDRENQETLPLVNSASPKPDDSASVSVEIKMPVDGNETESENHNLIAGDETSNTTPADLDDLRRDLELLKTTIVPSCPSSTSVSGPPESYSRSQETEFHQLRANCLKNRTLYEDPDFPASDSSLQITNKSFEWKRPQEVVENLQFVTEGVSRFDVNQGRLGNCWFLAAVANLTLHEKLFHHVVPHDNIWANPSEYAGIFHFRFWNNGAWEEVIVDDRLRTQEGKLVFLQSKDANAFWSCLLEKAYAKMHGSYKNLEWGYIGTAMGHFTGRQVESIQLTRQLNPNDLFRQMESALNKGCLLGCSILNANGLEIDGKGLVNRHAYSVTGVKMVQTKSVGRNGLIRIRNPWGNEMEWSGDWSDGHTLWNQVEEETRQELQVIFKEDGEFWFPIIELCKYFDLLEICYF